ncbi:hypothetical protein TrVE_jg4092 [Triparma verrucosa]|uniref:WW domain-containing protein n=1 Tax=Triparma verrucosa TaxID=1606542 RepID=A0A9W7CCH8_9STRA|nr:hypothetical protein TrVE_jg4092 [Triparma verrucosa]
MAKKSLTNGISSGFGDIEVIGFLMKDRTFSPVLADDNLKFLKQLLKVNEEVNNKQSSDLRSAELELKRKTSEVQALNKLVKAQAEDIKSLKSNPEQIKSTNSTKDEDTWDKYADEDGKLFFYNKKTKDSTYEKPANL